MKSSQETGMVLVRSEGSKRKKKKKRKPPWRLDCSFEEREDQAKISRMSAFHGGQVPSDSEMILEWSHCATHTQSKDGRRQAGPETLPAS